MNPSKCYMATLSPAPASGSYPAIWQTFVSGRDLRDSLAPADGLAGSAFAAAGAAFSSSGRVPVPAALGVSSSRELRETKALTGTKYRYSICGV